MRDVAVFEIGRRLRGTAIVTGLLVATVWLTVGLFPSVAESGVDFEAYVESFPPEVQNAFLGGVTNLGTLEGFLLTELYQVVWVLLLGVYFGALAAKLVAGDVEDRTAELVLAGPTSRARFVVGKAVAVLPVVFVVNGAALGAVLVGASLIGEPVDAVDFARLHACFVVYHTAAAGVGLVASASFDRVRRARGVAIGVLFATYLLDTLTLDTDYEWVGEMSLSRHFDAVAILVDADVDWAGLSVLFAVGVLAVVVAAELFEHRDLGG